MEKAAKMCERYLGVYCVVWESGDGEGLNYCATFNLLCALAVEFASCDVVIVSVYRSTLTHRNFPFENKFHSHFLSVFSFFRTICILQQSYYNSLDLL